MATSVNGWPASPKLHSWVGTEKTKFSLRHGCAGFVLMHNIIFFDRNVEDIDFNYRAGELDDWAYAYRPVRGYSNNLSNHASGTAVDINATEHPLGRDGTFSSAEEALIQRRLRRYNGAIKWGGNYHGRKDEMHFELDKPLEFVNKLAIELMDTPVGKHLLKKNPSQKAVILS